MSLLQPHSSLDKSADYATCSGKRIACVFACIFVCVCHLTQSSRLLIVCSQVKSARFLINTLSHTTEAQSFPLAQTPSPTYADKVTPMITFLTHIYTHTLNQV